jgi:hypothetical protein
MLQRVLELPAIPSWPLPDAPAPHRRGEAAAMTMSRRTTGNHMYFEH